MVEEFEENVSEFCDGVNVMVCLMGYSVEQTPQSCSEVVMDLFILKWIVAFSTQETGGSAATLLSAAVLLPEDGPSQHGYSRRLPGQCGPVQTQQ